MECKITFYHDNELLKVGEMGALLEFSTGETKVIENKRSYLTLSDFCYDIQKTLNDLLKSHSRSEVFNELS